MKPADSKVLYRFSEFEWLERSLKYGEFRLNPASYIRTLEGDKERYDDEQERNYEIDAKNLNLTHVTSGKNLPLRSNLTVSACVETDYYMLCLTTQGHNMMYELFEGADACLVIHDRIEFRRRILKATDKELGDWGAVDDSVSYGRLRHKYGAPFMKPEKYTFQLEWRFVWLPMQPITKLEPLFVEMGSIEDLAHIERAG